MGVDTKGVLLTPMKDVMLVCGVIEKSLNTLIRQQRDIKYGPQRRLPLQNRDEFDFVSVRLVPGSGMACFSFICFGEKRDLHVFFECDCDHTDLAPRSISMSLGFWGSAELYMLTVLHALSLFGPVAYDRSDCDDIDMALLPIAPLSLAQALALDFISSFELEKLVERYRNGELCVNRGFEDFVGMDEKSFSDIMKTTDHRARWDAMEAMVKCLPVAAALRIEMTAS
jgi:hypothetical protein